MNLYDAKRQFDSQRAGAKRRGIGWLLTFDEWLDIWIESGYYERRGREYCMARYGDEGPYSKDNVRICTIAGNNVEARRVRAACVQQLVPSQ